MVVRSDDVEAPARAETSHSRPLPVGIITIAVIVVVLAVVLTLVAIGLTGSSDTGLPPTVQTASSALVKQVTSLPAAMFDAVGDPSEPLLSAPSVVRGKPVLSSHGLPAVVWVCALYSPYCAAERWALVIALGRFGSFEKLYTTASSTKEVFGGTSTFSLEQAAYQSRTVTLAAVEEYGNAPSKARAGGFEKLQSPDSFESSALQDYDRAPWAEPGRLPFLDVANRIVISGSEFTPGLLGGLSIQQIANDLQDPTTEVAQALLGSANQITAALCAATGGRPSGVCSGYAVRTTSESLDLSDSAA
jgi:Domain of unknown function (DUF929)